MRKATYSDGLSTVASPNRWNGPCPRLGPLQASIPRRGRVPPFPPRSAASAQSGGRGCCLGTDLAGPETWAGGSCSPVAAMSRSRRCSERDTEAEADLNLNMHLHCTSRSRSREDVRMMRGRRRICSDLIFWTASGLQISQMLAAVPMLWRRPR